MSGDRGVSIQTRFEQDRLHDRTARLDRVIAALRLRARGYDGEPPSALRRSLSDFQSERVEVGVRLANAEGVAARE
jgi:hypothetical protein